MSWILQVQRRLESAKRLPAAPDGEGTSVAVVVPLYVESAELWTLLREEPSESPPLSFPAASFEGDDPWPTVARLGSVGLGVDPSRILRLGELDEVGGSGGFRLRACVVAVPSPEEDGSNTEAPGVRLPLSALRHPRLVEERTFEIEGQEVPVAVYHLGRHRLWGPALDVLLQLLELLEGPEAAREPQAASLN
ncbi:MAG: hypothetical protein F4X59_12180 [Holophagales bacterium]|nr:hypothetical protein [Holophagales bacterium]MYC10874.1 hypothetical protein [Holophagales bacterium]